MHDSLAFLVDENIKTLGKHCGGLDMKLLALQIQMILCVCRNWKKPN